MFFDKDSFYAEALKNVDRLREVCMGCKDCKGPCLELLQLARLTDLMPELREARS